MDSRSDLLLGTWRITSLSVADAQGGAPRQPFGAHPSGYLHYGADRRMYVLLISELRPSPANPEATDPESIALYRSFASYAGTYSVDGDFVRHHIDASWNQAWTGTTQVRRFAISGDQLHLWTEPASAALGGLQGRTDILWRRFT
jgi:hypothetical protein